MNERLVHRWVTGLYMVSFFIFLLGPLVVMAVSAFNTSSYPQVWPIEGLTFHWFIALATDQAMIDGLRSSIVIGLLVTLLSVPMGLAGALVMTQVVRSARTFYYFLVVAPVLTPGIVLGIATVVLWRDFSGILGIRSFIYNGTALTVLAQSSFIASYSMLIILSRLQRFDRSLEEAALDLGATPAQVFRQILLPFLTPAILSSAMLAFLTSFENYNATMFSILADKTLTTVLASQVRMGSSPEISALSTVIVVLTVMAALFLECRKRHKLRAKAQKAREIESQPAFLSSQNV